MGFSRLVSHSGVLPMSVRLRPKSPRQTFGKGDPTRPSYVRVLRISGIWLGIGGLRRTCCIRATTGSGLGQGPFDKQCIPEDGGVTISGHIGASNELIEHKELCETRCKNFVSVVFWRSIIRGVPADMAHSMWLEFGACRGGLTSRSKGFHLRQRCWLVLPAQGLGFRGRVWALRPVQIDRTRFTALLVQQIHHRGLAESIFLTLSSSATAEYAVRQSCSAQ